MPPPGGPATINGILYQLLGSLNWAAGAVIRPQDNATQESVTLILEPAGGGGDVQVQTPLRLRVEQWKARSSLATWSLREIINDVLPDLFLAVTEDQFERDVDFIFMTEGRRGEWAEAEAFFQRCAGQVPATDPRDQISHTASERFFPDRACTARELFNEILMVVRRRERVQQEPEELSARKLYFLLGRFRLETTPPLEAVQAKIDALLTEVVDYLADAPRKRSEAIGLLMDALRQGEARFTPTELMQKLGLQGRAFASPHAWSAFQNVLRDRLVKQIGDEGYDAVLDVRSSISGVGSKPITVISGESGTGKTWKLANFALAAAQRKGVAVWVRATGSKRDTLADVAWELWHYGLAREQPLPIDALAERLKQGPSVTGSRVTVFVDNVQSWDEARDLCMSDWSAWGFRLVVSMPSVVAQRIHEQLSAVTEDSPVGEFTDPELREFLHRKGREWGSVPADIRDTLKRPLLARIFCELAEGEGWSPKTEYELFSAYWRRVFTADGQVEHPGDAEILRKLARHTLEDAVVYPWPAAVLQSNGLANDVRLRLERVGWLRRIEPDGAEIWHDRLLNWAMAESVAELCRVSPNEAERLLPLVAEHASHWSFRPKRRFAYVAADFIWLLTRMPGLDSSSAVLSLIKKMEGSHRWSTETTSLYREILPTLGPEIVPALIARAADSQNTDRKPDPELIADTLNACLQNDVSGRERLLDQLINIQSPEMKRLAVLCLRRMPSARWLDWLWQIHRQRSVAIHQKNSGDVAREYESSFDAMVKCLRLQPDWLSAQLENRSLRLEELSDLVFLLSHLPQDIGGPLWLAVKADLIVRLSPVHRRALCRCIDHFNDTTEAEQLVQWSLTQDEHDVASSFAFLALCRVAPDRALASLRTAGLRTVRFVQGGAMRELFLRSPAETRNGLRQWMRDKPDEAWQVAGFFTVRPDLMDSSTLRVLLQQFERELTAYTNEQLDPRIIQYRCEELKKFFHVDALNEFARWSNTRLDQRLGDFVSTLATDPNRFPDRQEPFFTVLLRLGGDGMRIAVNAWLASGQRLWSEWSDLAVLNADNETREHLKRRAASLTLANSEPRKIPWDQAHALVLLAQLGQNATLVETVLRWGEKVMFSRLADVRLSSRPFSDAELQPALTILDDADSSDADREKAVWVLSISGRKDLARKLLPLVDSERISSLVVSALHVLADLESATHVNLTVLRSLLRTKDAASPAAELLIQLNTPEALDALEDSLLKGEPPASRNFPWNVWGVLLRDRSRRDRILRRIWEIGPTDPGRWNWIETPLGRFLPAIGELATREIEDFLWQLAFPKPGAVHHVGRAADAIRGLAKINPDEALRAAELQLAEVDQDREETIELIMELAPSKAVSILVEAAIHERMTWAIWHVAVALRRLAQPEIVRERLRQLLHSDSLRNQYVGAELAGWQQDEQLADELRALALNSGDDYCIFAAHRAIALHERGRSLRDIAEALRSALGTRKWQLADAWCEIVEPLLLRNAWRPQEVQDVIPILPENFINQLRSKLDSRLNDSKRRAEDIDKERGRAA